MNRDPASTEALAAAREVDALCDRFEQALLRGVKVHIEDWLPTDGPLRGAALVELVRIEIELRRRAGQTVTMEEYFARFPGLRNAPAAQGRHHPLRIAPAPTAQGLTRDNSADASLLIPPPAAVCYAYLAPAQGPDEIGRLGGYRVLALLGEGAMGVVFKAEDLDLQRPVALKVMKPEVAASPTARQRFLREARSAAKVKDDHVVVIYRVGEDRGVPFLAMEQLEGTTLDGWLGKGRRPTVAQVLRIGREIAEGLAAAHEHGLIHRDVKPANLWLDASHGGRIKILDFGLARAIEGEVHLTQTGAIIGTPSYMSPEQARGEAVDARSDLFSLGVVLYRLCTGRLPFQAATVTGVLLALSATEPPPAGQLNPAMPPGLAELVTRLLSKDAARRPATARETGRLLRELETPPTATVPPVPPPPAPVRTRRRRWRWVAAAAAVCFLAAVSLTLYFALNHQSEPPITPGDREKPFVLLHTNGKREEFRQFAEAAAVLRDGDALEVYGNGPFKAPALALDGRPLVLRAAPGYRPRFVPAQPLTAWEPWFHVSHAGVRIEGCDFDWSSGTALIFDGPECEIRNCRFVKDLGGPGGIIDFRGKTLAVADSFLSARGMETPVLRLYDFESLDLENNIVIARSDYPLIDPLPTAGQTIRLRHNTFIAFSRLVDHVQNPVDRPAKFEVVGNVITGGVGAFPDTRTQMRWEGRDNLYSASCIVVLDEQGEVKARGFQAWNQYWGREEQGSREAVGQPHFAATGFLYQDPEAAVSGAKQCTADLLRRVGRDLSACGPDWDRVGPGQAYVRDLEKELGRPIPKERLRPAAPVGGPFVILRDGKEVRGYPTLQQTLDAVRSGDVVEIRTDGPFPGGSFGQAVSDMDLTIRAAPGYRPVFSKDFRHYPRRGDFRLEGVFFDDAHFMGDVRNLTVRNCAFQSLGDNWAMGINCQGEGGPARFINCIAYPGIGVALGKGRTVLVDNCLTAGVTPDAFEGGQAPDLVLRRSAVYADGLVGVCFLVTNQNHGPRFELERSVLVCGQPLALMHEPASWKGSGNVYSVGGFWLYGSPIQSLDGWRTKFGGDADSLDAGPLPPDPTQWRLLPHSPGYKAAPDGSDMGADVSRIGVVTPAK